MKKTVLDRKKNNMNKIMKITKKKVVSIDHPHVTDPRIDKLSGVKDMKPNACGLAYSVALDWLQANEVGMVKATGSSKYPLAVKVHYPMEDGLVHLKSPFLLLQISSKKAAKPQIRFEYNPAHMTQAGEDYLNAIFTGLLGMTFHEFLGVARFTRIDFCRNILKRDLQDYLVRVQWAKFSQCFFGADGVLGTIYFGKSGSNQVIVYNKAKELFGSAAEEDMIRIEIRCRIKCTAMELTKFKNPFERVKVYSVACKHPPLGVAHWRAFQDSCRMRGINNAIKLQPADCRYKLKKALSAQPVSWWDITLEQWLNYLAGALAVALLPKSLIPTVAA